MQLNKHTMCIQPLGLDLAECSEGVCISKVRKGCSAERQGVRCVFSLLPLRCNGRVTRMDHVVGEMRFAWCLRM